MVTSKRASSKKKSKTRSGGKRHAPARLTPPPAVQRSVPEASELRRDILILMGNLLLHRGDGDAALQRYSEAVTLAEEQKQPAALADAHCRLGRLFRYRSEAEKATEHYERSIASARKAKDHVAAAQALWEWGVQAHFAGDRKAALQRLDEACKEWQAADADADVARTLALMATLHRKDGSLTKARALYEQAVDLQRAVCDHYELGITLGNLALLQFAEGEREDGLRTLQEAQALLKSVNAEAESKLLRAAADPLLVQD